ncbi:DUF551 domain-containing protein [Escherichia coli]|nr:DUF551 domain-containing protein [Escherichia coli]
MTTITKEWLQKTITSIESARDEIPFGLDEDQSNMLTAFKIALASLEAEPIGFRCRRNDNLGDWSYVYHREPDDFERKHLVIEGIYAAPPVPVMQADIALAIENLKQKLVECNRYNYCADAVKGVEYACRAVSYSQADNQPASGNQAAESNRGNEWTGNPDIDNAIIMLDRIDTLESCDDDRIEAVKAVLRRLAGNSPVTPDGWVMVPKQVTPEISNAINVVGQRCTCGNCSQRLWDLLLDATQQGVNRG